MDSEKQDNKSPAKSATGRANTLESIRNPMIFNALGLLVTESLAIAVLASELSTEIKAWTLAVAGFIIAAIIAFLNFFALKNPRFLTYGPVEYLRESELEHEPQNEGITSEV